MREGLFVSFPVIVKKEKKRGGADKKAKEEKKKKDAPAAAEEPEISMVDLRVCKINKIWEVEGSDKLYGEEVDIGEAKTRLIGSGVKKFVPI